MDNDVTAQGKRESRFRIMHSTIECSLCGSEDYSAEVRLAWTKIHVCSACVEHMSQLYDDLEREYDYELRRNEAQP